MYCIYFSNKANGTTKCKDDTFGEFFNKKEAEKRTEELNWIWREHSTFHWVEKI